MNELQQVLLVFAVIIVVGLYFFSRQKSTSTKKKMQNAPDAAQSSHTTQSAPKNPESLIEPKVQTVSSEQNYVPEAQAKLPFGDEFDPPTTQATAEHALAQKVIEIDDMIPVEEMGWSSYSATKADSKDQSIAEPTAETPKLAEVQTPQIFAILVLTSNQEFSHQLIRKTLEQNGLVFSEKGTFVKKVNQKVVLQVANVMEPGVFPVEADSSMTTPGIALILELPNPAIPAPGAMDDLIMTARRVSQRLNGRMYDMQRHLIRESDLQSMREAALNYESKKVAQ